MAVTLTGEQAKNSAASLRATAGLLDPIVTPTPTPQAEVAGHWIHRVSRAEPWPPDSLEAASLVQENFPTLAPRGQFVSIYKMWGAYPTHYLTTDKQSFYDPANIAVVDVDGVRPMELRAVSGRTNGKGKPSPCPKHACSGRRKTVTQRASAAGAISWTPAKFH
jgi:hypothetical protein